MTTQNVDIDERLKTLAFKLTIPFCYGCYKEAPSGRCATCLSDDLMRLLPGVGCEYGIEWVIQELAKANIETINVEEAFEESVSQCYPEVTTVGWMTLDTVSVMKDSDPISWRLAASEYIDAEASDGNAVTFDNGSTYHWLHDIESFLESSEAKCEKTA